MNVDRLDRLILHGDVPDLQSEVVSGQDIPPISGELDIRDGGDDFGEEGFLCGILFFFKDYQRLITRRDGALRFACWSHNADSRMSASLTVPFELEYMKRLQCTG